MNPNADWDETATVRSPISQKKVATQRTGTDQVMAIATADSEARLTWHCGGETVDAGAKRDWE